MKKIYNLMALMMLFIVGASQAKADLWYVDDHNDPTYNPAVTEIEAGKMYVLQNAAASTADYLCGGGKSTVITDDCIFIFEEMGKTEEGDSYYVAKQYSTGLYLTDTDAAITYQATKSKAFQFTCRQAQMYATTTDLDAALEAGETDITRGTIVQNENHWVFCKYPAPADYDQNAFLGSYFAGMTPQFWDYVDTNAWIIYEPAKATGSRFLEMAKLYCWPDGSLFDPSNYPTNGNPGDFTAEAVAEMEQAAQRAEDLLNNGGTEEECTAAAYDLIATWEKLQNSVIGVTPGYYFFVNWRDNGVVYESGSGANWKPSFDYKSALAEDNADNIDNLRYVWEVKEDGGKTYFQNYYTKRYLGHVGSMSTIVPTTESPETEFIFTLNTNNEVNLAGYFNVRDTQVADNWSLHTQVSGYALVYWNTTAGGSLWKFVKVDEADLDRLKDKLEQIRLNDQLSELYGEAKATYNNGVSYVSDASKDSFFDDPGIVTDPASISSNAPETSEGAIEYLLDGDFSTYFHSSWSTTETASLVHNLQIDLGSAHKTLVFKYAQRHNNSAGSPVNVHVYGSNDGENWVDQGIVTFKYPYDATLADGTEKTGFVGLTGIDMDAAYSQVRLDVESTIGNGRTNNNLFFYFSEFRVYDATVDEAASLVNQVVPAILAEFLKQLDAAQAELEAGKATKEQIDALQAAYDNFIDNYPDPEIVRDLIEEAQALAEAAPIGNEMGYFPAGSTDDLYAAIENVQAKVKDVMNLAEVNECKDILNNAMEALHAKLIMPEEGYYFIESGSTGAPGMNRLYAQNNGEDVIKWGGFSSETGLDDNINKRIEYMWKLTKVGENEWTLRNCATGTWMGAIEEVSDPVNMSLTEEGVSFKLQTAKLGGYFAIVLGDKLYANGDPNSKNIVGWGTSNGADNSSFTFIDAEYAYDGEYIRTVGQTAVITMPFDMESNPYNGVFCSAAGVKDGKIQLVEIEDDVIPAGTPVVYVSIFDETYDYFTPAESDLADIEYTQEALKTPALYGVLAPVEVAAGYGELYNNVVTPTAEGAEITANTGYFVPVNTDIDGDYTLEIEGELVVGVNNVVAVKNVNTDVYTLAGVKVRSNVKTSGATNGLPAGIYIVGGKKVLVK